MDIPTSELLRLVQGFLRMKKFARKDREFLKQHLKTRIMGQLLRELFWYVVFERGVREYHTFTCSLESQSSNAQSKITNTNAQTQVLTQPTLQ